MSSRNNNNGVGPCGACKFLRRKCVKGCIFAPYFDSEEGAANFAAVHKVFGASNAAKLLHQIPVSKRLDAVVTLCYEAFARVRDPVYGCVAHLFALQQQVVKLQAELAYIQARISTMQRFPLQQAADNYPQITVPSSENGSNNSNLSNGIQFDDQLHQQFASSSAQLGPPLEFNEDLRAAARDFVCRYLPPGVRVKSPASPSQ